MTYRLLALDLDGTLLGPDLRIHPTDRQALACLADRGVVVAIATGRMLASARPFAAELGIEAPLITYNGAWVRCTRTETDWLHHPIPPELAQEAIQALEATGLRVNVYLNDRFVITEMTPEAAAYMAHARVEPFVCHAWSNLGAFAPTKLLAIGPEERIPELAETLSARFAGRLQVAQSMPTFLEVTHAAVNKGQALDLLCQRLGIAREEVVAVGDGLNDVEMLAWAGLGVAMGNAAPSVKKWADRVTRPVSEAGVARLVDDLIREGKV